MEIIQKVARKIVGRNAGMDINDLRKELYGVQLLPQDKNKFVRVMMFHLGLVLTDEQKQDLLHSHRKH